MQSQEQQPSDESLDEPPAKRPKMSDNTPMLAALGLVKSAQETSVLAYKQALADIEKARADTDKARADTDKARADTEKARADTDKARADIEKVREQLDAAKDEIRRLTVDNAVLRDRSEHMTTQQMAALQAGSSTLHTSYAAFAEDAAKKKVAMEPFTVLHSLKTASRDAVFNGAVNAFNERFTPALTSSKTDVQTAFNAASKAAADALGARARLVCVDTHAQATINKRKPDISVVRAGRPSRGTVLTAEIVVIGELKNGGGSFSDADVGQLLTAMIELGTVQSRMPMGGEFAVIGFLCNADSLQFYEVVMARLSSGACSFSSYFAEAAIPVKEGANQLVQLMLSDPTHLFYDLPEIVPPPGTFMSTGMYLGHGATALGYLVGYTRGDTPSLCVAKVFTGHGCLPEQAAQSELDTMRAIAAAAARAGVAPQSLNMVRLAEDSILRDAQQRPVLLLEPLGSRRFAVYVTGTNVDPLVRAGYERPAAEHFCALVDALALLHALGFVHRDARPENFVMTMENTFILCDLGMAAPAGSVYDWGRGVSVRFGPMTALRAARKYAAERTFANELSSEEEPVHGPAEDYEQVARAVFAVAHGMNVPHGGDTYEALVTAWEGVVTCAGLKALLDGAQAAGQAVAACTTAAVASARAACPPSAAVAINPTNVYAPAAASSGAALSIGAASSGGAGGDAPSGGVGGAATSGPGGAAGALNRLLTPAALAALQAFKATIRSQYPEALSGGPAPGRQLW